MRAIQTSPASVATWAWANSGAAAIAPRRIVDADRREARRRGRAEQR